MGVAHNNAEDCGKCSVDVRALRSPVLGRKVCHDYISQHAFAQAQSGEAANGREA